MEKNKYLDLSRLWLLLRMEWFRSRWGVAMMLEIILGLLITGLLLEIFFGYETVYDEHPGNYGFCLIVGGFIISSLAFRDLSSNPKRIGYLTLPASAFEKFLSMWLLTSAGWVLLFSVFYSLYALIVNGIGSAVYPRVLFPVFNVLDPVPVKTILYYLVLQGVFLVGAVTFKGYVFPKTIFTIVLGGLVAGIVAYLVMADLIHEDYDCINSSMVFSTPALKQFCDILKLLFWIVLAPLCWVITYVGLKEKEV